MGRLHIAFVMQDFFFINFSNLQMLNHCYKFDRNNSDSDEVDRENVSILFSFAYNY